MTRSSPLPSFSGVPSMNNRYPLSPRLAPLRAILAKLDPPKPRRARPSPLKAYDAPSAAKRRRQRG
jgi:hypothetical protein